MTEVLLIDDEKLVMKYYRRALEKKGYRVRQLFDTDSALKYIRGKPEISIGILDIMMPPGDAYKNEDTEEGLKTGRLLYREFKEKLPDTPVIFLTNREKWDSIAREYNVRILKKLEYPPFDLADEVERIIEENKQN